MAFFLPLISILTNVAITTLFLGGSIFLAFSELPIIDELPSSENVEMDPRQEELYIDGEPPSPSACGSYDPDGYESSSDEQSSIDEVTADEEIPIEIGPLQASSLGWSFGFEFRTCLIRENIFRNIGRSFPLGQGLSWMIIRNKEAYNPWPVRMALGGMDSMFENMLVECASLLSPFGKVVLPKLNSLGKNAFYFPIVLRSDGVVVCVVIIRVVSATIVEIAYAATNPSYQRMGFCQKLIAGIQDHLKYIGVKYFYLSSVDSAEEFWMKRGFVELGGNDILFLERIKQLSTGLALYKAI